MFTQLLCTIDRNQNVKVYLQGASELWMKMFQDPAICRVLALASQSSRFDVLSDGQAGHFTARFPFSYAFFNAIEGLKVEAEKLPGALSESLSRLLEVVFPSKLYDGLSEELLSAYLSDFIDMKVPSMKSLPRPLQVLVTRKILTKHLGKVNQIVDVHSAFFDNEKRLNNTYALLDFFPALRSDYEALLAKLDEADFPLTRLDQALLELVLRELHPRPQAWETIKHQYEWLQKTSDCTPAVNALLQLETSAGALFDPVRTQWRGLQLQRHFLRDVTLKLGLDKALSLDFAQLVNSHSDFRLLESFLAVKAFLLNFVEKHPDPNAARPAASGLLEIYVSEFVLRASPIAELQTELLRALLTIVVGGDKDFVAPQPAAAAEKAPAAGPPGAAGKKVGFFDQLFGRGKEEKKDEPEQPRPTVAAALASALANVGRHLLASAAMKTYLLRTILQASNATVEQELVAAYANQPIQAEGCVLLVQVVEDLCQLSSDWLRPQVYENIEPAKLDSPIVLQQLRSFGHARYFLVNLAAAISTYMETGGEPTEILVVSAKLANLLLSLPGPTYRTFLLKQITKLRGVAAAQAFLNSPELGRLYTFFPDWKKDVKVNRFLRTKHVLNNPFQAEPNWPQIREAVQKAVEGNLKPLEALLHAEAGNGGFRGTLLLAVFQECSLLYTAQLVPHAEIEALFNLIQNSALPPFEKNICQAFMTNKFPGPVAPIFTITPETSKDSIMLISVILQAVSAALKQDGGLYRLLWENPQSLHDWYVPTMPQDARQALIAVLGGGWYECPNGHTYYVDACGRPTEILSCATCGAKIGGLDHVLDTTNKLSDRSDRSRPGIQLLEQLSEADIYTSERELQPSVYRLLQFVMNSIMFLAAWGGSALVREQLGRALFPDAPHRDPTELLAAHVQFDWTLMGKLLALSQEDLATLLGLVITVLQQGHFSAQPLKTTEARVAYENAVKATDARGRLALYYRNSTEGDSLLAELRETVDVGTTKQIASNPAQPLLWRFRTAISLASLTQEFESDVANHERFPILRLFLTQEEKLRAVKYFKKALDWQNMLTVRLDKRIDREYAAQTSVAEFLASLPREELHRWEAAWLGYKEAWNHGWRHVDRYTCEGIAEGLKGIVMDETLPLVFSLPDDKDEGACPLTLTHALADIHNQFIENLNELLKRRNKYFEGMEEFRIPTHLLAESHLIVYNVETELLPLVQMQAEQSLEYGHGTDVRYNFPRIEQHLIDTILSGKPLIDLEVRKFNFSNETLMAGTLLSLKAQIHQIELPGELKEKIVEDLGALSRLRNCKHQLEICMGFLAVTVGTNQLAGNLLLSDYAKNTLMLDATDFGAVVSKTVQLQHMVSLFMLLEENLNVDAFANVASRYKAELEHHHLVALEAASSKIDLRVVVAVLKDTLTLRLGDDAVMPAHLTLFEVLAESDDPSGTRELGSLDWFSRFPKELQLKHALHAYKFLASLIK